MGFKKMETNLTFTDISHFPSMKHNRAIARMEQLNARPIIPPFPDSEAGSLKIPRPLKNTLLTSFRRKPESRTA
jgi:hypothetical protein